MGKIFLPRIPGIQVQEPHRNLQTSWQSAYSYMCGHYLRRHGIPKSTNNKPRTKDLHLNDLILNFKQICVLPKWHLIVSGTSAPNIAKQRLGKDSKTNSCKFKTCSDTQCVGGKWRKRPRTANNRLCVFFYCRIYLGVKL